MRPVSDWPIHDRVLMIRLLSVFLASLAIPFTFLAARGILGSGAVYVAALLAVAPGFVIDAAHVANDGLAIGLAAIFLWLMTREKTSWLAVGISAGRGDSGEGFAAGSGAGADRALVSPAEADGPRPGTGLRDRRLVVCA